MNPIWQRYVSGTFSWDTWLALDPKLQTSTDLSDTITIVIGAGAGSTHDDATSNLYIGRIANNEFFITGSQWSDWGTMTTLSVKQRVPQGAQGEPGLDGGTDDQTASEVPVDGLRFRWQPVGNGDTDVQAALDTIDGLSPGGRWGRQLRLR